MVVMVVGSGKGGVGKTTIVCNLAYVMSKDFGRKVVLIDGNISAPHASYVVYKKRIGYAIQDYLAGYCNVEDIFYDHPWGIYVVPGRPTTPVPIDEGKIKILVDYARSIADIVLIDSPAGFGKDLRAFVASSDEVVPIANPEILSVYDCKRLIDIARKNGKGVPGIIVNKYREGALAKEIIEKLIGVPVLGVIHESNKLVQYMNRGKLLCLEEPNCLAAREIRYIAAQLLGVPAEEPKPTVGEKIKMALRRL